ncbi:uncharacterized protein LOC132742596 [Ruditapes philippinarum]|uniref:uncharacterized protein LOC132742596 n=1 Tax=Ruditapes philippinarum TaxID=129788 RepID=UPI00295AB47D|nr:uncharacterized protein LOC132742596 [Ruditapes philippinarum]
MKGDTQIFCSIICIFIAIACSIVSIAIPYWISDNVTVDNVQIYSYAGLWKGCDDALDVTKCIVFKDVKDFVNATRGLMIVGTVMFGFSVLLAIQYARNRNTTCLANMCIVNLLSGVILLITAMIVFGKNTSDSALSYGSGFYLPIASCAAAVYAAIDVARAKTKYQEYTAIGSESERTNI